ncbi:MAG: hypothetical protein ACFNLH_08055 [Corynebacterium matruchotii]
MTSQNIIINNDFGGELPILPIRNRSPACHSSGGIIPNEWQRPHSARGCTIELLFDTQISNAPIVGGGGVIIGGDKSHLHPHRVSPHEPSQHRRQGRIRANNNHPERVTNRLGGILGGTQMGHIELGCDLRQTGGRVLRQHLGGQ